MAIGSAGCGSSGATGGLSSADASQLRADIAAAKAAATRHDAQQAAASLVAFRQRVTRLTSEHKLTAGQAQALETGAQQAQARIALDVKPAPAPSPETTTITTPAPQAPAPANPPGKHEGHGKPPGKDKPPKEKPAKDNHGPKGPGGG